MKKIFCLFLSVFTMFMLISCDNENNTNNTQNGNNTNNTQEEIDIKIVGSYDNFEALEAEFTKFNEVYPNVRLTYKKLDDYDNTIISVLEGNSKPNIFFSTTKMFEDEKYNSVVNHMEDLSDASLDLDLACIRDGLINQNEGKKLYLPVFSRTYGMLVNKSLFKKENIEIPTKWNELVDACNSLKTKEYKSPIMGYSKDSSSCLMNTVAYPLFLAELNKNSEALAKAKSFDPSAGEYMRSALNKVDSLIELGTVDLTECDKIADNYNKVILRFFEGDVPMMVCTADTVSGTKKRESQSEAFKNNPFEYSFYPIPLTDEGGYFIDSPSIKFSVNKDCDNLEMTNKFMKFLITNKELNAMAANKLLVPPTKVMSFDSLYAPFGQVNEKNIISPEALGINDKLALQIRKASFDVGRKNKTIDEAIELYGTYK